MELSYMELRELICDVCHKMWQKGWVAANDGNVSVKLEDGTFLATPTGMSKSFITPEKLVHIDKEGNILEAEDCCRPSSEIKMHLRCYQEREDVGAVLHAHPPVATGFAVANKAFEGCPTHGGVLHIHARARIVNLRRRHGRRQARGWWLFGLCRARLAFRRRR